MTADSRKVTLRMGAGLHRKLQVLAERENRSVNQQMIHIIQHATTSIRPTSRTG